MNWDLNEREAREVIECRMREAWYKKYKGLSNVMVWWVIIAGITITAAVLIWRDTIKAWTPSENLSIGLPIFLIFFWPIVILYCQTIRWQIKAKKDAARLYQEPQP